MEAEAEGEEGAKLSIYKAARSIKRRENSLYNALRTEGRLHQRKALP